MLLIRKKKIMIIYKSPLTKWLVNEEKLYFMLFGICFTRCRYLEVWEYMELRIRERQYTECVLLTFPFAFILSVFFSWWCMLLPLLSYHLLYLLEKRWGHHSIFDWEVLEHCDDAIYFRKRKSFVWMKYYFKKSLPASVWYDQ